MLARSGRLFSQRESFLLLYYSSEIPHGDKRRSKGIAQFWRTTEKPFSLLVLAPSPSSHISAILLGFSLFLDSKDLVDFMFSPLWVRICRLSSPIMKFWFVTYFMHGEDIMKAYWLTVSSSPFERHKTRVVGNLWVRRILSINEPNQRWRVLSESFWNSSRSSSNFSSISPRLLLEKSSFTSKICRVT